MNTITFKDREYPIRTFRVRFNGQERLYTISVHSLEDAILEDDEGDEASELDIEIYYYVSDKVIQLPAGEICENQLDEKMEFIEEISRE